MSNELVKIPYLDPLWYARSRHTPGVDREFTTHDYVPGQPIPSWIKDPDSGQIVVNELKRYVKPFMLTTDPDPVTLAGEELSDWIPMVVDGKGHLEIFDAFFVSQRSEGFTVELFDPGNLGSERPILMNREVHVATIASGGGITLPLTGVLPVTSSAGRPFRWPQAFFMDVRNGPAAVMARFRNLSSSSNQIRFVLSGRRWYHLQAPWPIANRMDEIFRQQARTMPYFFTTDQFVSLTALGTLSPVMRFGDDSYVEWVKGMSRSTGRYTVRIHETATQKRLSALAVRDDLTFGNGEFPMLNWEAMLFEPNFQLTFELTNLTELTNVIWITLGCRKIKVDPKELEIIRPGVSPGRP